jgi:hypothetical protein
MKFLAIKDKYGCIHRIKFKYVFSYSLIDESCIIISFGNFKDMIELYFKDKEERDEILNKINHYCELKLLY